MAFRFLMGSVRWEEEGSSQIFLEEILPRAEQRQSSLGGEMTGACVRRIDNAEQLKVSIK